MPLRSSRGLAACAICLLGAGPAAAPAPTQPAAQCGAWPGEPEPLPQVGAADEFTAGWARLRREELRGLALLLEASDPLEARRLWLHAACLAPGDPEIAAALARTARPAVHRLVVAVGPPEPRTRRATLGAAFDVLATEARVPAPEPPPERASEPVPASLDAFDFAPIDAQIAEAAEDLKEARFQAAVDLSDLARARLLHLAAAPAVSIRRVRVELLGATARLALGQDEDARSCVERALREDPNLVPDPAESPPKLQRLVSEARAQRQAENAP